MRRGQCRGCLSSVFFFFFFFFTCQNMAAIIVARDPRGDPAEECGVWPANRFSASAASPGMPRSGRGWPNAAMCQAEDDERRRGSLHPRRPRRRRAFRLRQARPRRAGDVLALRPPETSPRVCSDATAPGAVVLARIEEDDAAAGVLESERNVHELRRRSRMCS